MKKAIPYIGRPGAARRNELPRDLRDIIATMPCIAGIDEVGVGPWAGPLVAAAVYFESAPPRGIDDSKILAPKRREELFDAIMQAGAVGVGIADVIRIDRDNVLVASHWAMTAAVKNLPKLPEFALVDGLHVPELGCPCRAVVDGDARIVAIAAASIIAKVTRDRLMQKFAQLYPGYGFERHKGYGTLEHRRALAQFGVTDIHRRSFKPVKALLAQPIFSKSTGG